LVDVKIVRNYVIDYFLKYKNKHSIYLKLAHGIGPHPLPINGLLTINKGTLKGVV
jgi:hypothetical protein